MNITRSPVKSVPDNHRRWRDKFRKECNNKIKNARQEKVDAFRENKVEHKRKEQNFQSNINLSFLLYQ